MKISFYVLLVCTFFAFQGMGQTVKTDVLVVGNGSNALAAGIQASVSGVKATILMREADFDIINPAGSLSSGLQAEYSMRASGKAVNTSNLIKSWTDSTTNLTVIKSVSWTKLKRAGGGWSMELSDGRKIRAHVLVNAERSGALNSSMLLQPKASPLKAFDYADNSYRTSIGSGLYISGATANFLTIDALLLADQDNLVTLDAKFESLLCGQAAGAVAAYAAFFKKKTSETNLKEVQGELIKYKLALVPFADVTVQDTNWRAIQLIGLSGILKGMLSDGVLKFDPERRVTTADVKEPIKEYYYKAQIWFDDYTREDITLGATLKLICYVKGKSLESTTAEVAKKWKTVYGFKKDFNPDDLATRREFAVLAADYMQPFNVTIDKTGRVTR